MQSHPLLCNERSTFDDFRRYTHARVQTECGLVSIRLVIGQEKTICIANITSEINCHFKKFLTSFKMYNIVQNFGEISKKRQTHWVSNKLLSFLNLI